MECQFLNTLQAYPSLFARDLISIFKSTRHQYRRLLFLCSFGYFDKPNNLSFDNIPLAKLATIIAYKLHVSSVRRFENSRMVTQKDTRQSSVEMVAAEIIFASHNSSLDLNTNQSNCLVLKQDHQLSSQYYS
jgi:hypothetical protein